MLLTNKLVCLHYIDGFIICHQLLTARYKYFVHCTPRTRARKLTEVLTVPSPKHCRCGQSHLNLLWDTASCAPQYKTRWKSSQKYWQCLPQALQVWAISPGPLVVSETQPVLPSTRPGTWKKSSQKYWQCLPLQVWAVPGQECFPSTRSGKRVYLPLQVWAVPPEPVLSKLMYIVVQMGKHTCAHNYLNSIFFSNTTVVCCAYHIDIWTHQIRGFVALWNML